MIVHERCFHPADLRTDIARQRVSIVATSVSTAPVHLGGIGGPRLEICGHRLVTIAFVGESFVGRDGELALLTGLVASVSAGVGGVVLVEGEQGIGKSSLLRAGLAGAAVEGCQVLWAAADELGQRFPLRLMAECLGAAGRLEVAHAPFGRAEAVFAGDPVLAGVERQLTEVDRLCAVSPVVLVAEDLQWADEASVLMWSRLCRAVGQMPLLLAGSCRPGTGREDLGRLRRGVGARSGIVLELGPLPEPEVAELVGGLLGGRPGRRLAGLVGRAGGNPLYARELADGLVREGGVEVAGGVAELAGRSALVRVPVSLAAAIGERLAGLAEDVVGLLRWAAVLGVEFSVTDLEVVSGRSAGELIGVIDAAVGAGVVAEAGPRLGFRHGLIRQVLYEGVPTALRAALHLQAARALAGAGAPPERVAAQLAAVGQADGAADRGIGAGHGQGSPDNGPAPGVGAGELAQGWIVEWLVACAPTLIYRAPQVTAELLRGVLAQLPDADPRRDGLEASLITVAFLLVRHDEVKRVGGLILARAKDPGMVGEAAWLVAYTLMRTGHAAEADAAVTSALAHPGLTDLHLGRLQALHAVVLALLGQLEQAGEVGQAALTAAERAGDQIGAGYAMHALSSVCYLRPDHVTRLEYIDRALATIGDDPRATDLRLLLLSNRPAALAYLDRQAEAVVTAQQALILAEQAGTPRLRLTRTALAHLYFEAGRWDDAVAELELVVDLPGPDYHQLLVHGLFALIAGHRGARETAEEHLAAVRDHQFRDVAYWSNAYGLLQAQALAAEQDGQPATAMTILAQCLDPDIAPDMRGRYELMPPLVRVALAAGDQATAVTAAVAAAHEAQAEPLRVKTAVAEMCQGLLAGEPEPALAAAGYFEATGRVLDRAMALEDAAVLAAGRGELPAARQALASAVGLYEAMGARWDIQRASARLRPYGIRRPRGGYRARPATGWAALTPTETKVAYLVAGGRSNPDVAAALFLSRNTVQTHVSHILAKLGARSRAEIIREALEHPPSRRPTSA